MATDILPYAMLPALYSQVRPEFINDWVAKLWSRFFCLSVYITMYLNDHQRSAFYESLGLNTTQVRHVQQPWSSAILCLRGSAKRCPFTCRTVMYSSLCVWAAQCSML
jgi:hypothetical protein